MYLFKFKLLVLQTLASQSLSYFIELLNPRRKSYEGLSENNSRCKKIGSKQFKIVSIYCFLTQGFYSMSCCTVATILLNRSILVSFFCLKADMPMWFLV